MEEQVEGSNSIKEGKENAKHVMDGEKTKAKAQFKLGESFQS